MRQAEAFKQASNAVSIHGSKASWTIIYPYSSHNISGPSGSSNADSYAKARRIASSLKAGIAIYLLGGDLDQELEADYLIECKDHDWRNAVRLAMQPAIEVNP